MHRLQCCDGNSENNEIQKSSHSALTSTGNDRNIDAFLSKVYKLNCRMLTHTHTFS